MKLISIIALISIILISLGNSLKKEEDPDEFSNETTAVYEKKWIDSLLSSMTLEEKLGQLFMIAAYSNKDTTHINYILRQIEQNKIGGLIFMQGSPHKQAQLTNLYQQKSKIPLLISIDAEWGLAMRLDSTISFPKQMALGAINNNELIYKMGAEIARQCKRLGIHINFAPVVDINSNPNNPVIGIRAFGENKIIVTEKALAYMKGLQDNGVLACAKHFPGHGDSDKDSHYTLPILKQTAAEIDTLHLYPFKKLISHNLKSIMNAHLFIPALDSTKNLAASLSDKIVSKLLKEKLNFKGLIFTDALNMKGVTSYYKPGEIELKAILAGNDILLFSENPDIAIQYLKKAVLEGKLSTKRIDESVKKILKTKYQLGLYKKPRIKLENIYEDLNNKKAKQLLTKLVEASVTIIQNNSNILPLIDIENYNIACVSIGSENKTTFQEYISKYTPSTDFNISEKNFDNDVLNLKNSLDKFNLLIVGLHSSSIKAQNNYGIPDKFLSLIDSLSLQKNVILELFCVPYILEKLKFTEKLSGIIVSYQNEDIFQKAGAEAIFGVNDVTGKLPVNISNKYRFNTNITTKKVKRLKYTSHEEIGISDNIIKTLDSIANLGIKQKAYPGCQILFAYKGNIFYNKAFGYLTYDSIKQVDNKTVYDLASITKIASTTLAIMHLWENKKISLDSSLGHYLNDIDCLEYKKIVIKDILTHQARLKPFVPFYKKTLVNNNLDSNIYRKVKSDDFPTQVAENLYIKKGYTDTIFQWIYQTPLLNKKQYKYSDIGFYFLKKIIENITNQTLDDFTENQFYKPLGLKTLGYLPLKKFPKEIIAPTEFDIEFRKQLIQGHVHDPGAAMIGGVAGHAGLFSNAEDLAVIMQMLLQKGYYGGRHLFKEETIDKFTSYQFSGNRRGLGFDKPERNKEGGNACKSVSLKSFGHTGFTGTIAWADPEYDLIFIFLSNRVFPDAGNRTLSKLDIRIKLQEVVYNAIKNLERKN